jgi:AbrB family looped-hinge helix DNA binding protein
MAGRNFAHELRVGRQGRVVIPASLRDELGLRPGEILVGSVEDGRLVLEGRDRILARLQAQIREAVPDEVRLVDELLAERRDQVRRDACEE